MAEEGFKRKLTAILSADVEGYSRLMGDDEEATVNTLTSYRAAISNLVQQSQGHLDQSSWSNLWRDGYQWIRIEVKYSTDILLC